MADSWTRIPGGDKKTVPAEKGGPYVTEGAPQSYKITHVSERSVSNAEVLQSRGGLEGGRLCGGEALPTEAGTIALGVGGSNGNPAQPDAALRAECPVVGRLRQASDRAWLGLQG